MSTGKARFEAVALAALTAAAFVLRAWSLGHLQLWVDEAATWYFARLYLEQDSLSRLLELIALEPTPPLYYGLVGVLMKLFGESDLVMRSSSVVFGAALVPAIYVLGRDLFNRRTGWIAAVLVAVHPWHVFVSREARVYPLLALWTVLLWWLLWKALAADTWRFWAAVTAVLAAACYSHFFGLFLGAAAGVAVLLWGGGRRRRLRGLAALALAGLLFVPYLAVTVPRLGESGAAWSVERIYATLPAEKRLGRPFELVLIGADYHVYMREMAQPPTPPWLRGLCLAVQLGLIAGGLLLSWRRTPARQEPSAAAYLVVGWALPLLVPWLVNHFHVFFQTGRHELYAVGPSMLLVALGLDALLGLRRKVRGRLLAVLAATVLLLGAGHRLVELSRQPPTTSHRQAAAWIAQRIAGADRVVTFGVERLVTEHYLRLAGSPVVPASFPTSTDDHPGWSDDFTLLEDEAALAEDGRRLARRLGEMPPGGRLFLRLRPYPRVQGSPLAPVGATGGMVSTFYLVDRHLLHALHAAGWQRVDGDETMDLLVLRRAQ